MAPNGFQINPKQHLMCFIQIFSLSAHPLHIPHHHTPYFRSNSKTHITMSYKQGIVAAIKELKDRTGSSSIAIKKHMQNSLPADKKWMNATFLAALKKGVADGDLVQVKNSYKLSADFKKALVKAEKKKTAPKPAAKKPAPKKPATKKSTTTKSTKTTSKKPAPKKKPAAKKPAAKKNTTTKPKPTTKKSTTSKSKKTTTKKSTTKKTKSTKK